MANKPHSPARARADRSPTPGKPQATPKAPPATPIRKSGGQILHDVLIEQGVEVLFGYPGGAILPTFDVLHKRRSNSS